MGQDLSAYHSLGLELELELGFRMCVVIWPNSNGLHNHCRLCVYRGFGAGRFYYGKDSCCPYKSTYILIWPYLFVCTEANVVDNTFQLFSVDYKVGMKPLYAVGFDSLLACVYRHAYICVHAYSHAGYIGLGVAWLVWTLLAHFGNIVVRDVRVLPFLMILCYAGWILWSYYVYS